MSNLLTANDAEARSLEGIITESEAWDATFSKIPLGARELKFEPEGIRSNGELHRLNDEKRMHLFEKAGA